MSAEVFAFVSEVLLQKQTSLLRWLAQWLCQPSLWLLKRMMRRFADFPAAVALAEACRHLLTRHWRIMQPLF
ncbi:hypothetical protein NYV54_08615 [Escherichia coli]|nr:hypothetical protein [Escherichia coli]MCW7036997.1 hypothetical protein [Escherichia coli]